MSKKTAEAPVDEFAGMGGSYAIDPASGLRVLVERTAPAKDQPLKEQDNGTAEA